MKPPDRPPGYVVAAALLGGWPAFCIARLLDCHCREQIGDLPPDLRQPLEECLDAIRLAAQVWADERRGTAEPATAERVPDLREMNGSMTTEQAADALKCTTRYVRKLIACGELPARREGGKWSIDAGAVLARGRG